MDVRVGLWRNLSTEELMLLNCGVGEDSWESLGLQGDPTSPILKEISPRCSLEGLMLELKLQYLTTSCEDLTHWRRLWCWEGLGAGGEGDERGWDGWMASLTRWTSVWVNSGSWWWTGRPGVLRFMGLQRVGHNWETELNWKYVEACSFEHMCMNACIYTCTYMYIHACIPWHCPLESPEAKSSSSDHTNTQILTLPH